MLSFQAFLPISAGLVRAGERGEDGPPFSVHASQRAPHFNARAQTPNDRAAHPTRLAPFRAPPCPPSGLGCLPIPRESMPAALPSPLYRETRVRRAAPAHHTFTSPGIDSMSAPSKDAPRFRMPPLERALEPDVMDTEEEAWPHDTMDHAAVNIQLHAASACKRSLEERRGERQ